MENVLIIVRTLG